MLVHHRFAVTFRVCLDGYVMTSLRRLGTSLPIRGPSLVRVTIQPRPQSYVLLPPPTDRTRVNQIKLKTEIVLYK